MIESVRLEEHVLTQEGDPYQLFQSSDAPGGKRINVSIHEFVLPHPATVLVGGLPYTVTFAGIQGFFDGCGMVHMHREPEDVFEVYYPLRGKVVIFTGQVSKHKTDMCGRLPSSLLSACGFALSSTPNKFPNLVVIGDLDRIRIKPAIVIYPGVYHGTYSRFSSSEPTPEFFAVKYKRPSSEGL